MTSENAAADTADTADAAENIALAAYVLRAATALNDGIQAGCRARGFTDVRPAHGFAFGRLAPDGATIAQIAEHLNITKQAASQMVDELVAKGYVTKLMHPTDARAKLVVLTSRGWACTRAAEAAAADTIAGWARVLSAERITALRRDLGAVAAHGRIRPSW